MKRVVVRPSVGFTLLEALITVAILGALLAVSVPSAVDWIRKERVRASAAEMVSDIQFARAEAIRRHLTVAVTFKSDASQSCYTVHTINMFGPCICTLGAGTACPVAFGANRIELKTVSLPTNASVTMGANQDVTFDPVRGLPSTVAPLEVNFDGGGGRKLRVQTNATGRPQVCAPAGSNLQGYPPCA